MARGRGRPRAERQDASGDLQRDHRTGDPRGVREPAEHRPEPGRCPADAAHRRPAGRLHPQPAPLAQGPRRPVGRPRPVRRRAARRRAGARDHGVRRPRVLDARGDPVDGGRRALRRGARPHRRAIRWTSPMPKPPSAIQPRSAMRIPASRRPGRAPRSANRPRRSRPPRSSRRRAASSASAPSGRCRSPSVCTRAPTRPTATSA